MLLLGIQSVTKSFGSKLLFENISFSIHEGERIGLIGPNGSGKSTLLKMITGDEPCETGSLSYKKGLQISLASQSPIFPAMSLEEILTQNSLNPDKVESQTQARILLGKAQFTDFTLNAELLSGGWKKRLDIVKALMREPDILLLDEPTNHLDLEGILWLEHFLSKEKLSYLVVSHDRYFLENVCDKIIELNPCYPGGLFTCQGSMSEFMERKAEFLRAQKEREQGLASKVRGEVEWLKRSPKARTTKARSRVQKTYELLEELSGFEQRNRISTLDIEFSKSEKETRKLLTTKNLSKSLGGKELFQGIDLTLSPGSRLGIAGRNGSGKTTLLKILAGQMTQDKGTLKYADEIKLVYFDQLREELPPNISLKEALSPTNDCVNYRGQIIHVNGWAKKFLFSEDRLKMPVKCLSGGEKARILLASLMLKPADILFLDEPTNDLDISTLEVIEKSLKEFEGAVVLISHDRCLMDRVCKQVLGLGTGHEQQFFADLNQWEQALEKGEAKKVLEEKPVILKNAITPKLSKMSYHEKKELEGMEALILKHEENLIKIKKDLEGANSDAIHSLELYRLLAEEEQKIERCFERWQYLLSLKPDLRT